MFSKSILYEKGQMAQMFCYFFKCTKSENLQKIKLYTYF